ncbi:MAG: exo-alpha-sialidase [Ruminococcaceae bacterium]|nr:exo-alpha-sialidase [Oscillospiraceae bacterium]
MALQKFSVCKDEEMYLAWPDLHLTQDQRLICVFTECNHHLDRDRSRICISESPDRGRTWTERRYLTEAGTKENYFNNARISDLRDGRLAIICDKVSKDENSSAITYLWFSNDMGRTWSEPTVLPFCGIVPDKLKRLKNGRIIISNHFYDPEVNKLCQHLWYSDDNMATWSDRITVARDKRYNLCEGSIIEVDDGVLVCFLRENSGLGISILKVVSYDNGKTWSDIYHTPMDSGHRPVSGYLSNGRVMVSYRYIPRGTQNVFCAILNKNHLTETERTKQSVIVFPLDHDRNPHPDLGYTGWVQFEDGEIYLVNYIKDDWDKGTIRGYSFYYEDIVLPPKETNTKNVFPI